MLHIVTMIKLRQARPNDVSLLRAWEKHPHIQAGIPVDEDWQWETELYKTPDWREQLIAELNQRPIGFIEIIDPLLEDSHYWGQIEADLRAIDIWIGEPDCLNKGYGTIIMELALERCFLHPKVKAVILDPLTSNTAAHRFYQRLGFYQVERRLLGSAQHDCTIYRLEREQWNSRNNKD